MSDLIIEQVMATLRTLPDDLQQEVLFFTKKLQQADTVGVPGKHLVQFAGLIEPDDLALMRQAIEEDCGQVNLNEW